jgi:predicted dehydrogenase
MQNNRVTTALIGIGRWGKRIAVPLATLSDLRAYVSTGKAENRVWASAHIKGALPMSLEQICDDKTIHAVVIATPIATHAEITKLFLRAGKQVLIEKPSALTSQEARGLAILAQECGALYMTGYTFLYSPVYKEMKRLIADGKIIQVTCTWKKFGTFGESIEYNLLTHHIALALDLSGKPQRCTMQKGLQAQSGSDSITATLFYEDSTFVSTIDRRSSDATHTIAVTLADRTMYLWEGAVLRMKKPGEETYEELSVHETQPLTVEIGAFLSCIAGGPLPPTSGNFDAEVLSILEQAELIGQA